MIYLDNAATTMIKPEIRNAIIKAMDLYGNPSSQYNLGRMSYNAIESSRETILNHIGDNTGKIVFTSCGSEANNMVLKGFNIPIITTPIEHKSILNTCKYLEKQGIEIHYAKVDKFGRVDLDHLEWLCSHIHSPFSFKNIPSFLASVQTANNEIGTMQNMDMISFIVHKFNGLLHTDMVQYFPELNSYGIDLYVNRMGIDIMSVSGHKFGCPKGIGFLYMKKDIEIEPLIHGGKQEYGLRAGTENVPYIVGLAKGVELLNNNTYDSVKAVGELRDKLYDKLKDVPESQTNGYLEAYHLANNLNMSFKGVKGTGLATLLNDKGICVSTGSACNSGINEHSHVLKAIGVSDDYIDGTIRMTLNKSLTDDNIEYVAQTIKDSIKMLRSTQW